MSKKQRFVMLVGLGLIALIAFMFVGLPFAQFGWTSVQAQYGPGTSPAQKCGSTVALMLVTVDTPFYADAAMTNFLGTLRTTGPKANQKFFACTSTLDGKGSAALYLTAITPLIYVPEFVLVPIPNPSTQ